MFGVSKSEEANTALDKAAPVLDSSLSVQEQNWFCKAVVVSFSATELLQIPYHHFLIWILGPTVFFLPLLSVLFLKDWVVQIN